MRHPARILLLGIVLIGLGAWALWTIFAVSPAEGPAPASAATSVTYTVLAQGERSSVRERKNYHITTDYQLRELWKLITTNTPPPSIDFETESVIAVFAGRKPTAGYEIAITRVEDTDKRMVSIEIVEPGISCLAVEVESTPFQVLKLAKTDLPLTHQNTNRVEGCLR